MDKEFSPKHAKPYANLNREISSALKKYASEVSSGKFPDKKHSTSCANSIINKLK